jgi:Rieske Fe-S protein
MAGSASWMSLLQSCAASNIYRVAASQNQVAIPVSLFHQTDLAIVRVANQNFDIAIRRKSPDEFLALQMNCTHADNHLVRTGNGFRCNLHGSLFDHEGNATKGPATHPLKSFASRLASDQIIISLA